MGRPIPPDVREEVRWLYNKISNNGHPGWHWFGKAIRNNSLALNRYCRESWSNYLHTTDEAGEPSENLKATEADRRRAEEVLDILDNLVEDKPKPDVTLYLSKSERAGLEQYCKAHDVSKWEAMRQALHQIVKT